MLFNEDELVGACRNIIKMLDAYSHLDKSNKHSAVVKQLEENLGEYKNKIPESIRSSIGLREDLLLENRREIQIDDY